MFNYFQVVRDLGFMIPDILHVIIPLSLIDAKNAHILPGGGLCDSELRTDVLFMIGTIFSGLCLCSIL